MDLTQMMQMVGQLKEQLAESQEAAQNTRVQGESGGGLVKVTLNGRYEVVELEIDPKMLVASEKALVEDLVRAAFNQASERVASQTRDRMGGLAKNMGVDLSAMGLDPSTLGLDGDDK